jgi:hypothetical protein
MTTLWPTLYLVVQLQPSPRRSVVRRTCTAPVMDTTANIEDSSRDNEESVVNESIECSNDIYIYMCVYIYHALTS